MLSVASMMPLRTPGVSTTPTTQALQAQNDPNVEMLKSMFPDVERDVLLQMLSYHSGNVERVINTILDTTADVPAEEADAQVARNLQSEQDEEMAKAIAASMQAEDERRKQKELPAVAARAVSDTAARAKAFLAKVTPKRAGGSTSTHGVRLLDSPLEVGSMPLAYDLRPIEVPTYAPPPTPAYTAPEVNDAHDVSDAPEPPPAEQSNRYSSRMDRARSANRQRLSSSSTPPTAQATLAPLQASVPVGALV